MDLSGQAAKTVAGDGRSTSEPLARFAIPKERHDEDPRDDRRL